MLVLKPQRWVSWLTQTVCSPSYTGSASALLQLDFLQSVVWEMRGLTQLAWICALKLSQPHGGLSVIWIIFNVSMKLQFLSIFPFVVAVVCVFLLFCMYVCLFVCFWDRVSLCGFGCPETHYVDQACLKHRDLPTSAFQELGLKVCTTTASWAQFLHLCDGYKY